MLQDASQFAANIDMMMKQSLGIPDEQIEEEEELEPVAEGEAAAPEIDGDEDDDEEKSAKEEL